MKTSITIYVRGLFIIILTLVVNACKSNKPVDSTGAEEIAIRKVVEEGLDIFTRINKDNASEFVRFMYAEDAIIFPPNEMPIKGIESITRFLQTYPLMTDYKHEPKEIVVFGDYAYLWETWSVTLPLTEQTSYKNTGTIFWIWHKQFDESWKLWREIWHSDIPLPESASTSKL
jgi:ketosteroid isomerase-like protein